MTSSLAASLYRYVSIYPVSLPFPCSKKKLFIARLPSSRCASRGKFLFIRIAYFWVIWICRGLASRSLLLDQVLGSSHIDRDVPVKGGFAQKLKPFLVEVGAVKRRLAFEGACRAFAHRHADTQHHHHRAITGGIEGQIDSQEATGVGIDQECGPRSAQRFAQTRKEFNIELGMINVGNFPGTIAMPGSGVFEFPIPGTLLVRRPCSLAFLCQGRAACLFHVPIKGSLGDRLDVLFQAGALVGHNDLASFLLLGASIQLRIYFFHWLIQKPYIKSFCGMIR